MESEYNKLTSELDAREILRYLNNLGIHNISGEVLKYFITDLKKLIKYDLLQKQKESSEELQQVPGFERLHSASTFSSRLKSKTQEGEMLNCNRHCRKIRKPLHLLNTQSAPNIRVQSCTEKPLRRACSCVRIEKKSEVMESTKVPTSRLSNNIIKVQKQPTAKKCDPVSLYHYYTALWEKYKSNLPGENNWSDLRWTVRQKMAGNIPKQNKVPDLQLKSKHKDKD